MTDVEQRHTVLACLRRVSGHKLLCISVELLRQMAAMDREGFVDDDAGFFFSNSNYGAGEGQASSERSICVCEFC